MTTCTPAYTPGPYFYERQSEGVDDLWTIKAQRDQKAIASIVFWDDDEEWMAGTEADARLLASAPDLLGALKQVITAFEKLILHSSTRRCSMPSARPGSPWLWRREPSWSAAVEVCMLS